MIGVLIIRGDEDTDTQRGETICDLQTDEVFARIVDLMLKKMAMYNPKREALEETNPGNSWILD